MGGGPSYDVEWSDASRTYRYVWRHRWTKDKPPLLVAGLIPSGADESQDDPTVRFCGQVARCRHPEVGRAAKKGFGELVVVNMYSRYLPGNTKASGRRRKASGSHTKARNVNVEDLIGPDNNARIEAMAREVRDLCGTIVVAWGDGGWSRHGTMLRLLGYPNDDVWCFATRDEGDKGKTDNEFPCHPSPQGSLRRVRKAKPHQVVLKKF